MTSEDSTKNEIPDGAAAALVFLQRAAPEVLLALEVEVPTMAAEGPERCSELGSALDKLRGLSAALEDVVVTEVAGSESPASLEGVAGAMKALDGAALPEPLASAVASARAGVDALLKFVGEPVDVRKPYPQEHAARMREPGDFVEGSFRSKQIAPGVRLILGKLTADGPMTAQAYRFDKEKFTAAEARKWLKDHDAKPIKFEEAAEKAVEPNGAEVLAAALALVPAGNLVAGCDETWEATLKLAPADSTAFLVLDSPPAIEPLTKALAKRGAPWLIDVENCEANRAWLSMLARVFRVKGWPLGNRLLGASFAPAGEVEWLDSEATVKRVVAKAEKKDERYVLGVVLEPEVVDSQKDIYSAAEIRQCAHRFMEEFRNIGLMHKVRLTDEKVKILETYLAPCDFKIGKEEIKAGSWLLAARILDDELWKAVKKGEITGWSIGGSAVRRPERRGS